MKFNHFYKTFFISTLLLTLTACNDHDQALDKDNFKHNDMDTVSSLKTNKNSVNYPHTIAIKVQEAKYQSRVITNTTDQNTKNIQQQTQAQRNQPSLAAAPKTAATTQGQNEFVAAVIQLTNAERQKNGLPALQAYPELNNVANVKAKDMNEKGYFSHTSPTYGSPFDMMRDFGITYQSAGENIAQGQRTPQEVVNAWMNSEGHRANILNKKFTHIGVGFQQTGYEWVQMFVKK
ncbi:CAP domain-containing protein [Niallia sp. NCCP-28]|uniref:CAP domain-containing protein n=1 Tax=Niallia sp. NCCP-28 TaxID=2934712 RepID=UPI0020833EDB|nr:CAP domain-containing protein [Niallia sp. NCCP-28]GKU83021.1 hypothetical protein NCCP28_24170 [Niallia sp. NCCP-28]